MSEISWETVEAFINTHGHLLTEPPTKIYMPERADNLSQEVHEKVGAIDNCIEFVDGTVLETARPDDSSLQNIVYSGHKKTCSQVSSSCNG